MTKQNAFTQEDLLRCSRGELFGPGNAQLPAPNMLMVDRITHISEEGGKFGKGELVAELDINPDLWFFACHFEGDPVMPGCLGLDAMWQLVGFFLGWQGLPGRGRAFGLGRSEILRPGSAASEESHLQHSYQARPEGQAEHGHRRWLGQRRRTRDLHCRRPAGRRVHLH